MAEIENRLLYFYSDMVNRIQNDKTGLEDFFEQAFTCMILCHELNDIKCDRNKMYEILFMYGLTGSKQDNDRENIIKPFSIIDRDYYNRLLDNEDIIKKLTMYSNIFTNINGNNQQCSSNPLLNNRVYLEIFKEIIKLRKIIRRGWINRHVPLEYCESDEIHIAQMIGIATAYFRLYKESKLDEDKVMEMILIHEVGEILAGDIPEGDLKHDEKGLLEERAVRYVFRNLKTKDYFIQLWKEFEARETDEARFVYELDKIDPVIKAFYLDRMLNRNDLFPDFYQYEENRQTFNDGYLKKVFSRLNEKNN